MDILELFLSNIKPSYERLVYSKTNRKTKQNKQKLTFTFVKHVPEIKKVEWTKNL